MSVVKSKSREKAADVMLMKECKKLKLPLLSTPLAKEIYRNINIDNKKNDEIRLS